MLFSESPFSELPISSTFSMVRTRNNKDIALNLELAQKLDITLKSLEFKEIQQYSVELYINTLNEVELNTVKFEEHQKTLEIDLHINTGAVNVVPNS